MKPCVTPVLDDIEISILVDALEVFLERLERMDNRLPVYNDAKILKQRFESLLDSVDSDVVQVLER